MIQKYRPAATAEIGVPFTYTLVLPEMNFYEGNDPSSPNDLHSVTMWDDLTAVGTDGNPVQLRYLGHTVSGLPDGVTYDFDDGGGYLLTFDFGDSIIPAHSRIEFEITVVLDDVPENQAGDVFINVAEWEFGRLIYNEDDPDDEGRFFNPLPGESGVSLPMVIVEPDLIVSKSSPDTALNMGDITTFTIDVQNVGGGDAWEVTILDLLQEPVVYPIDGAIPPDPTENYAGMCEHDPSNGFTADIYESDGTTLVRSLEVNIDYQLEYIGPGEPEQCRLVFTMTTNGGPIAQNQRLIITYTSQLDQNSNKDGVEMINIAGATEWFSADGNEPHPRRHYERVLSDGTPDEVDHEDRHVIQTALSGYYFQKTVTNLTSGVFPAKSALPGDVLRYRLRLFNVDQLIEDLVISDTLDGNFFDLESFTMVSVPEPEHDFNDVTGELKIYHEEPVELNQGQELVIEFDIVLLQALADGEVINQAEFTADINDPNEDDVFTTVTRKSDDPYHENGVAGPDDVPDPTIVQIQALDALSKANTQTSATIGEQFSYLITVPETPSPIPLYNVRIKDDLDDAAADLRFVGASVVSGGNWAPSNAGSDTDLTIEDTVTGINIPANGQAVIEITVELLNTALNQRGLTFTNSATYTYNRALGIDIEVAGEGDSTDNMTIVEPDLTMTKSVDNLTNPGGLAAGGDTLEYTLLISNSGDSIAYDIDVIDHLPVGLALIPGTATAEVNNDGVLIPLLDPDPDTLAPNTLAWGSYNGDELTVPVDGVLELKYQVSVAEISADSLTNEAWVAWSSLDGGYEGQRTGEGCGMQPVVDPDNYCFGPVEATIDTLDTNAIDKAVLEDTWDDDGSIADDAIARVGDTVTYSLTLSLREGLTRNVTITDELDPGLAFVEVVSINGMTGPYTSNGVFTHADILPENLPAEGATGELNWVLGDIYNAVDDGTNNDFVIVYRARVLHEEGEPPAPEDTHVTLNNVATLAYTYEDGAQVEFDETRMQSQASVEALQPLINEVIKSGTVNNPPGGVVSGDGLSEETAYLIDIVNSSMDFEIRACNDGQAPAYGLVITDQLAAELDETSISNLQVSINDPLDAADYSYEGPEARGGQLRFTLHTTLDPGACATVAYTIGFHDDIAPDQTWFNAANVDEYWSRPTLDPADARLYAPVGPDSVWMTNAFDAQLPTKTSDKGEATIGEEVVYTITVPGEPVNAALSNVTISDTIDARLEYLGFNQTDGPAVTDNTVDQNLSFHVDQIPAGEQVVIAITSRVRNELAVQGGADIENTVSYDYDNAIEPLVSPPVALHIVEPSVVVAKSVSPDAQPTAGDILTYSLAFTAEAGADFSDAFNLTIVDQLSVGLAYQAGSVSVDGVGNTINEPVITVDGVTGGQILTWDLSDASIRIPAGETVTVSYDVEVLSGGPGAVLRNEATGYWTSLEVLTGNERSGADCPDGLNDYCTSDFTQLEIDDNTSLAKSVNADSWTDEDNTVPVGTVRIGDTVTYHLSLWLQEGVTRNVRIADTLPEGMEFVSSTISSPSGVTITHNLSSEPQAGDTDAIEWVLGDITNEPSNDDTPLDELRIEYVVRVAEDAGITHQPQTTLTNTATLSYHNAQDEAVAFDADRMEGSADVTVYQPLINAISKVDQDGDSREGSGIVGDAYLVDIVNDTMSFQLEACNDTGLAPAYGVVITDQLAWELDEGSLSVPQLRVGGSLQADGTDYVYTPPAARGGEMRFALNHPLLVNECVTVDYQIGFHSDVPANQEWSNSATVDEYWSLPPANAQQYAPVGPTEVWMSNAFDAVAPTKTADKDEATIGEEVVYTITVPGEPVNAALNDVTVTDTLESSLAYVSATATLNGAPLPIVTEQTGQQLSWQIAAIPAGEQVEITLTTRVVNAVESQGGSIVNNAVSYTHEEDGVSMVGGTSTPVALRIVEPEVVVAKTVAPDSSPGAGDVLTYTLTFNAAGGAGDDPYSDAFDLTIEDSLSLGLAYEPGSATVDGAGNSINDPSVIGNGLDTPQTLSWDLTEASIAIPEGGEVIVTYQVRVLENAGPGSVLENSVTAYWTSLSGASADERTGADCPDGLNNYCTSDFTQLVIDDNTSLAKAVDADSWTDEDNTVPVGTVRIGDTVTYHLSLWLQEGTTRNVSLSDILPEGMEFVESTISSPSGAIFNYTLIDEPPAGDTGTIEWVLGDITNEPSNDDTPLDELRIAYTARVMENAGIAHQPQTTLTNTATLSYNNAQDEAVAFDADRMEASAEVTVYQPVIDAISKVDQDGDSREGSGIVGDAYLVDIVNDTMSFQLEACNDTGLAPAYGVVITDQLAWELDEGSLSVPQLRVGGSLQADGPDYVYTPPAARGGEMRFELNIPLPVGECVTVDYQIGFYPDVVANQEWSNRATVDEYWSLPPSDAQQYIPVGQAEVWMSNVLVPVAPDKSVFPADQLNYTIGEEVSYEIVVPSEPVNAALDNVVISDTLDARLEYLDFTPVSGPVPVDNSVDQALSFQVDHLPAGEQVVFRITARVRNIVEAQAPDAIENLVSYTFDGASEALLSESVAVNIVEPNLTMVKAVSNITNPDAPAAGDDVLEYTLTITNDGASIAYDTNVIDRLPAGLTLVDGSATATIDGVDVVGFVAAPSIDGATLIWGRENNGDETLDIPANGGELVLSYRVTVDAITAATFDNTAYVDWTSLDGERPDRERTGAGCPDSISAPNEYCFGPATASIEAVSALAAQKTVANLTSGESGAYASPGDQLRYTIVVENISQVPVMDFSLVDELDALNTLPMFVAGSLSDISVPLGATDNSVSSGGDHGTGLIDVSGLNLDPGERLTIEFTATLVPVIASGAIVLNQGELRFGDAVFALSDDPAVPGEPNPTETLITSAPQFEVLKTSQILEGDPEVLFAGEMLRYTITVRNIGNEDAVDVLLRDNVPANTSYVPGSTTLNGVLVDDAGEGLSPLQDGILIHAPVDPTDGNMPADVSGDQAGYVATISFDVRVNPNALDGTIISNQGFVQSSGEGSGEQPEAPSDDPGTDLINDPTRNLVGNLPLIRAHKTVVLHDDLNNDGIVNPEEVLRYTIVLTNPGPIPATGVELIDAVPQHTSYVANSLRVNGEPLGEDNGISPLIDGIPISSEDLTLPFPGEGEGTLTPGEQAIVTFDVRVDPDTESGTLISNQGTVRSNELPNEPTDADGDPFNGHQPTVIVVGDAQRLQIDKQVSVVNGTTALPGTQLEYLVQVTNIASVPATDVVIRDDLSLHGAGVYSYVDGSARLNGGTAGIAFSDPILTADYAAVFGDLPPGESATLRFRVLLDDGLEVGRTVTNTAVVHWNNPEQTAQDDVSIDIGAVPGEGTLNGLVWHDANFNEQPDDGEAFLADWTVEIYRNGQLLGSTQTDANGAYHFGGLISNDYLEIDYELRFHAPWAGTSSAQLGHASSPFTNEVQRILDIELASGSNLQGLNLPIQPNGVVYDAVRRTPVAGAILTMVRADNGAVLPAGCFDDPAQQNQVTPASGHYRFDINFSESACLAGGSYLIRVTPPGEGFIGETSLIIPPQSAADTDPFSVPACLGSADNGDAIPATTDRCEATTSIEAPPESIAARSAGTYYYLHLTLANTEVPAYSQIFNNHIPLDPVLDDVVAITKTSDKVNVTRSDLVPYTIRVHNTFGLSLQDMRIVDTFPPGFKYVKGSARYNGEPLEPEIVGNQLYWDNLELAADSQHEIKLLFIVGAGVSEGEYINRAQVVNMYNLSPVSGEAMATVRVVPDPTFDCTDIIGKVFDDKNLNGVQDEGEAGIPGARLVTARGLIITTDEHGRFHLACAAVPSELRGSNFIIKLDDRSLPTGYRVTTENPRVQRATRGKMMKFNFGATLHRAVRVDIGDGVFLPDSSELREHWKPRIDLLLEELKKAPAVLRISYLADVEREALVRRRVAAMKQLLASEWEAMDCCYQLTIETEVFWRRGSPPRRSGVID